VGHDVKGLKNNDLSYALKSITNIVVAAAGDGAVLPL
jgi:hypothetical protein